MRQLYTKERGKTIITNMVANMNRVLSAGEIKSIYKNKYSITTYVMLHMLEFYHDCVDKYLSCEDFEYSEMDTDMDIWQSLERVSKVFVKNFRKRQAQLVYHPRAPQGKHMPGLFKVEFGAVKINSFCSKSYCTEKFTTGTSPGQVKFSMKSVTKNSSRKRCHITNMY